MDWWMLVEVYFEFSRYSNTTFHFSFCCLCALLSGAKKNNNILTLINVTILRQMIVQAGNCGHQSTFSLIVVDRLKVPILIFQRFTSNLGV